MKKKPFYSQLFRRKIEICELEYWPMVYAETLYRIEDLESRQCTCFKCSTDLQKYREFLTQLKSASLLPENKP